MGHGQPESDERHPDKSLGFPFSKGDPTPTIEDPNQGLVKRVEAHLAISALDGLRRAGFAEEELSFLIAPHLGDWRLRREALHQDSIGQPYALAFATVTSIETGRVPSFRHECIVFRSMTRSPARTLTSCMSTRNVISPVSM